MKNLYFVYYCIDEEAEWTSSNETFEVYFDYDKALDFARDVKGKVYDADITPNGGFEVGCLICDFTESTDLWSDLEEECEILTEGLEWIDGELQFSADSENVVRY